jgi:DNA-binding transcriptional LysR family regulator
MPNLNEIDLNALAIFEAVAGTGSFTAAAQRLDVAKAKVSLQVARLERQLGVQLFARTTRQVTLTDAGRALLEQCAPLLRGLAEALDAAGGGAGELSGMLRVATTVLHATESVGPCLAAFAQLHPRLAIDLRTGDRVLDMVAEGIDVSFRMGWLRDSTQRAIKLADFTQHIVAAPGYLERHGRPTRPDQLARHEWLTLTLLPTPLTWTFSRADGRQATVRMSSRIQVDSPNALLALAECGAGVTALESRTLQSALKRGTLVKLLGSWSLPQGGMYAVLPPGRHVAPKVRAFVDFYRDWLARKG